MNLKATDLRVWHESEIPDELKEWFEEVSEEHYPRKSGVVCDPFSGSGTTVRVANALGVRGIGIDLSSDYNALAGRLMSEAKLIINEPHSQVEHEQQSLF